MAKVGELMGEKNKAFLPNHVFYLYLSFRKGPASHRCSTVWKPLKQNRQVLRPKRRAVFSPSTAHRPEAHRRSGDGGSGRSVMSTDDPAGGNILFLYHETAA